MGVFRRVTVISAVMAVAFLSNVPRAWGSQPVDSALAVLQSSQNVPASLDQQIQEGTDAQEGVAEPNPVAADSTVQEQFNNRDGSVEADDLQSISTSWQTGSEESEVPTQVIPATPDLEPSPPEPSVLGVEQSLEVEVSVES